MFDGLALIISLVAMIISALGYRVAVQANSAAIFDRRFEVYRDAELFVGAWIQHAKPDMDQLSRLVGAWSRSYFLFEKAVTSYLRQLWLDAVDADYAGKVMAGEAAGDRQQAIEKSHDLLRKHADFDALRNAFLPYMKVTAPHWKGSFRLGL